MNGVGYAIGCLLSIIQWKLERRRLIALLDVFLHRMVKSFAVIEIIYGLIFCFVIYIFGIIPQNEFINALTAFIIIDISNAERRNLKINEKTYFYDTISSISKYLIGGFVAPLFYVIIFGNGVGICYMLVFNISSVNEYYVIKKLFNAASIIPSIIVQFFLYFVYLLRNKSIAINFRGDYLSNCIKRPLLNIDIFGAYIESVNFYYYFNNNGIHYVKSYGEYTNRIDIICIKDYLSITYGIAMIYFVIFFIFTRGI